MPRPGTKQVIRTTVRGPSTITKERRDAYREQLQGYMKSRTDLKAGAPQATPGPAPVPAYKAPSQAGGMGGKSAAKRAQRNAQARAHRATLRQRKLGSPLSAKAAAPATPAAPAGDPEYDPDAFNASKVTAGMPPRSPEVEQIHQNFQESVKKQEEQGDRIQALKDRMERRRPGLPEPKIVDADPGSGAR